MFRDDPMLILDGQSGPILTLAFSPDGSALAAGTRNGSVWLWDEGYEKRELWPGSSEADEPVNGVEFSPDGNTVVAAGRKGCVGIRTDRDAGFLVLSSKPRSGATAARFLGPNLLAIGYGDRAKPHPGSFELRDLATDRRREPVFTAPEGVRAVAVAPTAQRVAWSEWGRRVSVWEPTRPEPVRFNLTHNCPSLSFHPDGHHLATAVEWGAAVFDLSRPAERLLNAGRTARYTVRQGGIVSQVAFSPDGRSLATGSWDETVRLWDAATGHDQAVYHWGIGKVFALAYSPDGLRMAAGGARGAIAVWDIG